MFILTVPYEERSLASSAGARWFPGTGWAYVGATLPKGLQRYAPKPYSWDAWLSEDLSGKTYPTPGPESDTGTFDLRTDQLQDVKTLLLARKAGAPEFLVGNDVGTGKTVTALSAIKRMSKVKNVLVVCPLPVAANWRLHLDEMGDGGKRWCIINYESAKRLLEPPASAAKAKSARTKNLHIARSGKSKVDWDVVVVDEGHYRSNPESQRTRIVDKAIVGGSGKLAFAIQMSATAGSNPAELSYMHRGLFWSTGRKPKTHITADEYVDWCQAHGFSVSRGGFGNKLKWEPPTEKEGEAELKRLNSMLFGSDPRWGIRRRPDWPEQQRFPVPVELSEEETEAYEADWAEFKDTMKRIEREKRANATKSKSSKARAQANAQARTKGLAAMTRYRQKAGLVRAPGTADFAVEMIRKGRQVAISCEYTGTVNQLVEELQKRHVEVATYTGENRETREDDRIAYQRGEVKVIIYTPTEGFSLHANERAVGGNDTPRVTVVAEPRWSPKKALQAEGRSQRDGNSAPVYYSYALGTVEQKVIKKVIWGMKNTSMVNGEDVAPFDGLADTLEVPFLVSG